MSSSERVYQDIFFRESIFSDFYFFNVGHERCEEGHSHGPTVREDYVVHYIESGKGTYEVNSRKYRLGQGDFFIIKPDELTYYEADNMDPWDYYWFGFSGNKVTELLQLNGIGLYDYVGKVDSAKCVSTIFDEILALNLFEDRGKMTAQSLFFSAFSNFKLNDNAQTISLLHTRKRKYSESFTLHIKNNYYRDDLSISEISQSMNLNSAYLSQIIKEEIGYSPKEYLKEFRLGKALFLLETSDMLISEIACGVGYKSSESFSRAFKNYYGVAPTHYSKI